MIKDSGYNYVVSQKRAVLLSFFACLVVAALFTSSVWYYYQTQALRSANADLVVAGIERLQTVRNLGHRNDLLEDRLASEKLWLARALVSESDDPKEWPYVAWVIRNRVEDGWRGKDTYEGVILDPYQFSAFNPRAPGSEYYRSIGANGFQPYAESYWSRAKDVAENVILAESSENPVPDARYFLSPVTMNYMGYTYPNWYYQHRHVEVESVDSNRFMFFADT